jgi:hypothetical protein
LRRHTTSCSGGTGGVDVVGIGIAIHRALARVGRRDLLAEEDNNYKETSENKKEEGRDEKLWKVISLDRNVFPLTNCVYHPRNPYRRKGHKVSK